MMAGGYDTVIDRIFLPSSAELGNNDTYCGTILKYFETDAQNKRIKYWYIGKSTTQLYYTCSPASPWSMASSLAVSTDGSFSGENYVYGKRSLVFCCVFI